MRHVMSLSCLALLAVLPAGAQSATGGVTIYTRVDDVQLSDTGGSSTATVPLKVIAASGLKIAFLAHGTGGVTSVPVHLFDERAQEDTIPRADAWVDESWRPVLYRGDRFRYAKAEIDSMVGSDTSYEHLLLGLPVAADHQGALSIRQLVVYGGEDVEPPTAPRALTAEAGSAGVQLGWSGAEDNVGVALYVVSRADASGKFVKIAETSVPSFVDRPTAAGAYRYRVLAVDYQDNLSGWSPTASATVEAAFAAPPATDYETDRAAYADAVRRTYEAGRGKVVAGRAFEFGDSLSGATLYQLNAEAALDRYTVEAIGRPGASTAAGRETIAADLERLRPQFCLVLYGTNNVKDDRSAIRNGTDDLLAIARACMSRGAIPIVATIPPRGFTDPQSKPEAEFNQALIAMCHKNHLPIAYMFEALQREPDRHNVLYTDGIHWDKKAFTITPGVWKQAVEQVTFALLDRPERP